MSILWQTAATLQTSQRAAYEGVWLPEKQDFAQTALEQEGEYSMLGNSLNIFMCRNEYDGTVVWSRYAPLLSQRHKTKHTKPKPAVG